MRAASKAEDSLAESALLYDLGKTLSAELNLSELLTQITDAAVELTKGFEGLIALRQSDSATLYIEAIREAEAKSAYPIHLPVDEPPCVHVAQHARPLLLMVGDRLPDRSSDYVAERALLYVPLIVKGHAIGTLGVRGRQRGQGFSQHDQDMLTGLAGYAAIAIENARLYSQAVDRTYQLGLLVESANALSWSLELDRVLNAVARQLMRSLEASWCIIGTWNPRENSLRRLGEYRRAAWPTWRGPRVLISQQPRLREALEQVSYVATGQTQSADGEESYSRLLTIPLQHQGRVVGIAEISSLNDAEPFDSDTIRKCIRAALAIGPNIVDPRRADWQEPVTESARALIGAAHADFCTIYIWEQGSDELIRLLDYGDGHWIEPGGPSLAIDNLPTLQVVVAEQRTTVLHYNDPILTPEERALFKPVGKSALILLPLVFKARTIGLVRLYDLDPAREFTERDLGLALALANQAAVALENAHLVRDLQRSLDEQKAMQSQLVRAARLSALGELTAVIAHQINNPLTTILGDAEILVQDTPNHSSLNESALAIRRAGERAKTVVERLLNMARSESDYIPLDVNKTISEAVALVEGQLRQGGISLSTDLTPGLPSIRAIPGHLEDVWMNLLVNARDAVTLTEQRQRIITITSALSADSESIQVVVKDNGIGISPENLERIFDPMFTTKPHGKGTGLGLYICRQILTDHNGRIAVTSTVGRETYVTVFLPVSDKQRITDDGTNSDR